MSTDLNRIAREKLASLVKELERVTKKLSDLASETNDEEDLLAIGALNDRAALYLQDIILMVVDDRDLNIDQVMEFIELVEHYIVQIDDI